MTIQNASSEDSDQCVAVQADLKLRWTHMSAGMFPDVAAYLVTHLLEYDYINCEQMPG